MKSMPKFSKIIENMSKFQIIYQSLIINITNNLNTKLQNQILKNLLRMNMSKNNMTHQNLIHTIKTTINSLKNFMKHYFIIQISMKKSIRKVIKARKKIQKI